jgi:hypothetical protein
MVQNLSTALLDREYPAANVGHNRMPDLEKFRNAENHRALSRKC